MKVKFAEGGKPEYPEKNHLSQNEIDKTPSDNNVLMKFKHSF